MSKLTTHTPFSIYHLWAASIALGIIALVLIVAPRIASAESSVAGDDFEGGIPTGFGWLDEWNFFDDARITEESGPHQGQNHLRLRNSGAAAVRSVDTSGEIDLRLRFWARGSDFDDGGAVIEVSEDGSNYVTVQSWGEDDEDGQYTFYDIDLSTTGLSFNDRLWFRARVTGESDDDDEEEEDGEGELVIDEIELVNTSTTPDPNPEPDTTPIVIDGKFDEWDGKAHLDDAYNDQTGSHRHDIAAFYWANNIDEEINYHMIERHTTDGQPLDDDENAQEQSARFIVYMDTNNNGEFFESGDRRAVVTYVPHEESSSVNVKIYPGDSNQKISDSGWNDWGDSEEEGGLRVEFPLDWNDLGIQFGDVIRMYTVSFYGVSSNPFITDRVPDGDADIQWSPASVLGPWLLGAASVAGIAAIWFISRRRRLWT